MLVAVTSNSQQQSVQNDANITAAAAPTATPIKKERRDSSSSLSSLDELDNGGKKLNAVTSTPVVTSDATIACGNNTIKGGGMKCNQGSDTDRDLLSLNQRIQESDETNDYDDDESADEKISTQPRQQLHYKRRLSSRSLNDKTASVLLEYNADNPNSLRKKFRFNRYCHNANGDESGFVDASHSSQLMNATSASSSLAAVASMAATNPTNSNNGSKSNSSTDSSSPPQSNGNSSPESGIGEREDMKYMCPICDVVSQTAHQFTNHIRCHNYASGHTENFTCRICSKVLSSASSLDRHVLVHTGERPFNCKYCHLTFTTNGNMHRHMRTHKQHQHTHHRRNSNGTKFNANNSNNNNNTNNTTSTITPTGATNKTLLNNGQLFTAAPTTMTATVSTTLSPTATTTAAAAAAAAVAGTTLPSTDEVTSSSHKMSPQAGANGNRLNGNANLESDESDGGCSSDSSAGRISHNNNNSNNNNNNNHDNQNNNNNNDLKINNNNYKRKHSEDQTPTHDFVDELLKRRLRPDISENTHNNNNNNNITEFTNESIVCPICNENNFPDVQALDQHMDSRHPEIPAKCKNCDVLFRTHHQLSIHPCTADIKGSINLSFKQRRLSESSSHEMDRGDQQEPSEDQARQRHELYEHFKNAMAQSNSPSSHYNHDPAEDDIKSEPSAQDSKDLADIQSILNMTASSNNSNLLRNFEQSVNTPSSQYSYDRDEEEAQDSFTAEFRKMKLLGEFPCKLCKAVYPNLRALKGHNRVHLSEAGPAGPFRCNMCPYLICDKAALIRHMRTHNGDRPYECAVCNYAFTTKANCERHLRNRHAKTTREEVKRAIIYHPSEDSSCDDTNKKLHMFSSELEDECDLMSYHQHQPKDRSTPVSHLKERLTAGESPSSKQVKIQVKNLEDLMDKSSASSGYHDSYDKHNIDTAQAPIDMSMDVLDLSKKPTPIPTTVQEEKVETPPTIPLPLPLPLPLSLAKPDANLANEMLNNKISTEAEPKLDVSTLEKQQQQLLLAQKQLLNDPTQLMQQLYCNLLFPQFPPFFMHSSFMPNNLADFQKLAPILTRMMGGVAGAAAAAAAVPNDMDKPSTVNAQIPMNSPNMPPMNPLLAEKPNTPSSLASMASPKGLMSPNTNHISMPRHLLTGASPSHHANIPPTMLSNGPVKMVLKNGVFMPKQKQRRYRTERPFACEHCSARFTLRSNMERHVKQQHPQFYAQRQRSGHHVMRGRGANSAANMNSISHLQAAVAQAHYGSSPNSMSSHSPISDQVKYAILAQQLKARKDTDLLQQALAHGSNSVANANMFSQSTTNASGNGAANPFGFSAHHSAHVLNQNGTPNGSMEDDEPKLIIDEDDDTDDEVEDEEIEEIPDDNDENEDHHDIVLCENQEVQNDTESGTGTGASTEHLPTTVEEVKLKTKEPQETAKKVAESILEQAIKAKQTMSSFSKTTETPTTVTSTTNSSMKTMIAQAPAVGKFLKEVASSSFKDESQDLASVSELVDNATNNAVSFNSYFRPSDVANHMEPSDEDGLVASSASESNNSGAEDTVSSEKPKKKSAYSLAPNRVHCPYCQRMFPWSSSLRRHILTHTGQKPFKCSHCPLLFTTKSNCDRHLLRKHGDVESAMSVYVPTEDVNEPIPLPKSVEEIERMQREREEEERKRKAEEQRARLAKEQMEKQKLEQEQQQQQQQKQAFLNQLAATQFQQQFPAKADSANSQVSSSDLPFKCHLCESSFAERLQCLEHIKLLHSQEFALLLSKGAIENEADTAQLNAHEEEERQQRSGAGNEEVGKGGKYPDYSNRKVICAFCMRRFWSTEDLRRHMRTHSGERPFQCEICLRKFTLKHSMLRHMKKHNGLHMNGGSQSNNDNLTNGNSGSDYSDDEQQVNSNPLPSATDLTLPANNISALLMGSKFRELLNKTSEWRNGNCLNMLREGKENNAEDTNTPQPSSSDLIGNLLGISDQGILNKLMSSPDEAAKLLGVEK